MTKPAEIPSTMRALVAYGKHDYRLEPAYPVPGCGDDEMLSLIHISEPTRH